MPRTMFCLAVLMASNLKRAYKNDSREFVVNLGRTNLPCGNAEAFARDVIKIVD